MSVVLHPGAVYRTQFHKLATRQQFSFVSGSPAGLWVKTSSTKYAAPAPAVYGFDGQSLLATNTGRVKYWQGATFYAAYGTAVQAVYPSKFMTEDDKRDW